MNTPTLDNLGLKYHTDKASNHHNYLHTYSHYLEPLRDKPILLIEAGVGGYTYHNRGGESFQMWCEYFQHGRIATFDIYDKSGIKIPNNGMLYRGSQDDVSFLTSLVETIGRPDIVIDDASHVNPLTIKMFEILFPLLKPNGIYIIEDVHTNFYEEIATDGMDFKGKRNSTDLNDEIILNYLYRLCNKLCIGNEPNIKGIHFYKEVAIIEK